MLVLRVRLWIWNKKKKKINENASAENVGSALGYLLQSSMNSTFIGNQLQFWVGDIVAATVERKIFTTASEAGKEISKLLEEKHGKSLTVGNIDAYKRMAERTPVELRNPKADATAYLAVSSMKVPRKGEDEKEDAYKKRLGAFEADRKDLQNKLSTGEITSRKDILPEVDKVLINHGIKSAPEGPTITIGQHLALFFHATFGLDELLSVHEGHENEVVYKVEVKGKSRKVIQTKEQLEAVKNEAYAALTNALYSTKNGVTAQDFIRGYVEKKVKVEVTKDAEGKPVMEDQTIKDFAYPLPFFEPEEQEEEAVAETAAA